MSPPLHWPGDEEADSGMKPVSIGPIEIRNDSVEISGINRSEKKVK